eukprot:4681275-Amphidinium_carterae.1
MVSLIPPTLRAGFPNLLLQSHYDSHTPSHARPFCLPSLLLVLGAPCRFCPLLRVQLDAVNVCDGLTIGHEIKVPKQL